MCRDSEMNNPTPMVCQNQKHVKDLNRIVGTVKKSTDTKLFTWLSRNVLHVCDGGLLRRTMYLLTLVSPISIPSFSSSPWIFGAPQIGFWRLIVRISSCTSFGIVPRPGFPRRIFQVQNKPNPLRCQPITVDAFTINAPDFQSCQVPASHTHRSRSAVVSLGRFTERCRTPI